MPGTDRLDLSNAMTALNAEEKDACDNVLNTSQHVSLKLLPNHHIDKDGELRGYVFLSHLDDMAQVLPFNKRMFDMIALYECSPGVGEDSIFHADALRMINNVPDYRERLREYVQSLEADTRAPAGFDCIPDSENLSRFSQHPPDQRTWKESIPDKIGIYHAFTRSNTKDKREHKLFIVIAGCLHHACEELQNLWHDCREHYKCRDVLESEEVQWLRGATLRNHNRIASDVARFCDLRVKRVIDSEDPTGQQRMVLPTTFSYKSDCSVNLRAQKARVVDGGCFLDTDSNGVLFEMFASEGFWLFQGPKDLSDIKNVYGSQFNHNKVYPCFPTQSVRYHARFPMKDARNSVRVLAKNRGSGVIQPDAADYEEYLFPDETFFRHLQALGFNRNDGVLNLMPIICYVTD